MRKLVKELIDQIVDLKISNTKLYDDYKKVKSEIFFYIF